MFEIWLSIYRNSWTYWIFHENTLILLKLSILVTKYIYISYSSEIIRFYVIFCTCWRKVFIILTNLKSCRRIFFESFRKTTWTTGHIFGYQYVQYSSYGKGIHFWEVSPSASLQYSSTHVVGCSYSGRSNKSSISESTTVIERILHVQIFASKWTLIQLF